MDPISLLTRPLRSLLGDAERDVESHSPLGETRELETKLGEAVTAAHRAAESLENHVEVIDALAQSLPPLTQSVTRLTEQIGELLRITAPLEAAERDVSRLEHLFGRRGHREEQTGETPPKPS